MTEDEVGPIAVTRIDMPPEHIDVTVTTRYRRSTSAVPAVSWLTGHTE